MTITARYFFRQLTPEVIRLYGDYSVSRHRANNLFLPVAIENKIVTWRYKCFNTSRPRDKRVIHIEIKVSLKN